MDDNINQKLTRREWLKWAGLAAGAGALTASYPFLIEPYLLQVNHYNISIPRLPAAFDGFRIVQLTDMHIGPYTPAWFLQSAIDIANRLEKDITVFTGDAVQSGVPDEDIAAIWQMLAGLQAPEGVYAVFGNHDHSIGFDKSLYYAGKHNLSFRHQTKRFVRNGQRLWLGGLGDLWDDDDLGVGTCFANSDKNDCRIALAHNPDTADESLPCPIDLFICGHTHGGQVNLPLLTQFLVPIKNKAYIHGCVKTENSQVFISRGIGWGGYPIRFRCPPEIAVLELRRGE
jgi:uncharacterized protein